MRMVKQSTKVAENPKNETYDNTDKFGSQVDGNMKQVAITIQALRGNSTDVPSNALDKLSPSSTMKLEQVAISSTKNIIPMIISPLLPNIFLAISGNDLAPINSLGNIIAVYIVANRQNNNSNMPNQPVLYNPKGNAKIPTPISIFIMFKVACVVVEVPDDSVIVLKGLDMST